MRNASRGESLACGATQLNEKFEFRISNGEVRTADAEEQKLWARCLEFTQSVGYVSANLLKDRCAIGWRRSKDFAERLVALGYPPIQTNDVRTRGGVRTYRHFKQQLNQVIHNRDLEVKPAEQHRGQSVLTRRMLNLRDKQELVRMACLNAGLKEG